MDWTTTLVFITNLTISVCTYLDGLVTAEINLYAKMFNSLLLPIVITIATMTATATPLQTTLIVNFVSELKEAGGAFRFEVADTEGGNTPPPPNKWSTSPDVVGAAQFNETDEWSLIFWQREGQTALFQLVYSSSRKAAITASCEQLMTLYRSTT